MDISKLIKGEIYLYRGLLVRYMGEVFNPDFSINMFSFWFITEKIGLEITKSRIEAGAITSIIK